MLFTLPVNKIIGHRGAAAYAPENTFAAIDKAFDPFKKKLKRPIEREDILKLTEKPVRRIYRLDINELIEQMVSPL